MKALSVVLLDGVPYMHLAAAAATRELDDDRSWTDVFGHEEACHGDDAYKADEGSNDSEDWHPDDDFEDIDPDTLYWHTLVKDMSADVSTHTTSLPKSEKHTAETSPTYPAPIIAIFIDTQPSIHIFSAKNSLAWTRYHVGT